MSESVYHDNQVDEEAPRVQSATDEMIEPHEPSHHEDASHAAPLLYGESQHGSHDEDREPIAADESDAAAASAVDRNESPQSEHLHDHEEAAAANDHREQPEEMQPHHAEGDQLVEADDVEEAPSFGYTEANFEHGDEHLVRTKRGVLDDDVQRAHDAYTPDEAAEITAIHDEPQHQTAADDLWPNEPLPAPHEAAVHETPAPLEPERDQFVADHQADEYSNEAPHIIYDDIEHHKPPLEPEREQFASEFTPADFDNEDHEATTHEDGANSQDAPTKTQGDDSKSVEQFAHEEYANYSNVHLDAESPSHENVADYQHDSPMVPLSRFLMPQPSIEISPAPEDEEEEEEEEEEARASPTQNVGDEAPHDEPSTPSNESPPLTPSETARAHYEDADAERPPARDEHRDEQRDEEEEAVQLEHHEPLSHVVDNSRHETSPPSSPPSSPSPPPLPPHLHSNVLPEQHDEGGEALAVPNDEDDVSARDSIPADGDQSPDSNARHVAEKAHSVKQHLAATSSDTQVLDDSTLRDASSSGYGDDEEEINDHDSNRAATVARPCRCRRRR